MKTRIHALAGIAATALVATFMTATIVAEVIIRDRAVILGVKTAILFALIILIPSVMIAGSTGRSLLAAGRTAPLLRDKKRRAALVAVIGLTVLVPCAITLRILAGHATMAGLLTSFRRSSWQAGPSISACWPATGRARSPPPPPAAGLRRPRTRAETLRSASRSHGGAAADTGIVNHERRHQRSTDPGHGIPGRRRRRRGMGDRNCPGSPGQTPRTLPPGECGRRGKADRQYDRPYTGRRPAHFRPIFAWAP